MAWHDDGFSHVLHVANLGEHQSAWALRPGLRFGVGGLFSDFFHVVGELMALAA